MLRRLRGVFGTALTWGAAWGLVGATIVAGVVVLGAADMPANMLGEFARRVVVVELVAFGISGAIAGTVFASVLGLAERRARGLAGLSIRRVAVWGGLGGLTLPVGFVATQLVTQGAEGSRSACRPLVNS